MSTAYSLITKIERQIKLPDDFTYPPDEPERIDNEFAPPIVTDELNGDFEGYASPRLIQWLVDSVNELQGNG